MTVRGAAITYAIVPGEKLEENFRKARALLDYAKAHAASRIEGADQNGKFALDLVDDFNNFVAGLDALLDVAQFAHLPGVTKGGIPVGSTKHFTVNGWSVTIVLDVPKKVAVLHTLEPTDATRLILNALTGGKAGE